MRLILSKRVPGDSGGRFALLGSMVKFGIGNVGEESCSRFGFGDNTVDYGELSGSIAGVDFWDR
ncbi:hypothetical protein F2Q68_00042076 [Brassica cretica]|uniref:Uncharacterized protein n=1 Tax=Brassica cretica TaxID=69181 RepID=A0A8S9RCM6_BRACR|nr:hypothetical protein F2Q68_00042076 [Brassica cretica]KAF3515252.1 hypothetical protein F2Q69_00005122 [Brassica cretica]KAF3525479.1 hypothetical protein F2Q69_00050178 [Brassica cretica]KAF3570551.1 hypothetical protein F2Q69_00060718 [Brassica cretica]